MLKTRDIFVEKLKPIKIKSGKVTAWEWTLPAGCRLEGIDSARREAYYSRGILKRIKEFLFPETK